MKMIKTLILPIAFSAGAILLAESSFAQEAKIPCLNKNGSIGLNDLEKFDCNLTKAVVNDPHIKENFKNKVNKKLAEKLEFKATQRLEEIALIDGYFEPLNFNLLGSKEVENKCRLDVIANPKCPGSTDKKSYQAKLNYLLQKYPLANPGIKSDPSNGNLVARMRAKMGKMRGAKQLEDNQCPVQGSQGYFFLNSQFSEDSAKLFLEYLKENRNDAVAKFYSSLPQFQMLKDIERMSTEGAYFFKKFEDTMKSYDPSKGSAKDFVESIFQSSDAQKFISKVLADNCGELAKNFEDYLCSDLDHLGMSDNLASDFLYEMEGDENEYEVDLEVAKGFSCGFKIKNSEDYDILNLEKEDTITSRNRDYTSGIRSIPQKMDINITVGNFCELYMCEDKDAKNRPSCMKKDGRLSSNDLLQMKCNGVFATCDSETQKRIAYLRTFEKDTGTGTVGSSGQSLASGGSTQEVKPARSFSSFYQNFLGVEGTLVAEGKKITPSTIAEKQAEFVEKKLDPNIASLTASASQNALNKNGARPDMSQDMMAMQQQQQYNRNEERFNSFVSSNPNSANEEFRRNLVHNNMKGAEATVASKKKADSGSESSDRTEEMKKLRAELAEAINSVKGTDAEKLATVAESNKMALAPKGAGSEISGKSSLSIAEQNRLDQYRDNLNAWESRLKGWQSQLSDRDYNGRAAATSSGGATPQEQRRSVANDDFGNSSSSDFGANTSGIKLTKSSASAPAAATAVKAEAEGAKGQVAEGAVEGEQVMNSENLALLKKESLKNYGIVAADSFIIKVRHLDRVYDIPVKTFNYNGKSMFVPLLNDRNRDLARIVYNSPLFNDYRQYQADKDKQR